jgi:hypothetical protein
MNWRHCFFHDNTPIDNEKFAPNIVITEPNALTNSVVTLQRLINCDLLIHFVLSK